MSKVVVVGTVCMDLVVRAPRFPEPGDSLVGSDFRTCCGGKGANRAVGAARLGAEVSLIACVGDDSWGKELRAVLAAEGVGTSGVTSVEASTSGVTLITIGPGGDTTMVGVDGANDRLSESAVDACSETIAAADIVVLHGGVPAAAAKHAADIAHRSGKTVLLNAAPVTGVDARAPRHDRRAGGSRGRRAGPCPVPRTTCRARGSRDASRRSGPDAS